MKDREATVDEVLATFSAHISKSYPSPQDFRKNFELLLKGKRGRSSEAEYADSLEKNIVYLNDLVASAEALLGTLLLPQAETDLAEKDLSDRLNEIERAAHDQTAKRHREAFIEGTGVEFKELLAEKKAGEGAYLDKLEFNYRYLMTLRIFLFEFIGVLAAIRAEYRLPKTAPAAAQRIRNHIEVTAHYYLGNVAVGEVEEGKSGAEGGGAGGGAVNERGGGEGTVHERGRAGEDTVH